MQNGLLGKGLTNMKKRLYATITAVLLSLMALSSLVTILASSRLRIPSAA
jgi:hypothetical protein